MKINFYLKIKGFVLLSEEQINIIHKKIGSNIAKIRKEKHYSQLKLSLEMGHSSVSLVSFAEINLKGTHFNIEHLLQIAHILNVDIARFFDGINLTQN